MQQVQHNIDTFIFSAF